MPFLTHDQQDAVEAPPCNLQIIACAGSGKTEVVGRRVANLLDPKGNHRAAPREIVAFTFTERAAAELRDRIALRTREQIGEMHGLVELYVGTIHGWCLELLKTEVPEYLKFEVLNEVQQILLVDRNSRKSGLTETTTLSGQVLKRYIDTDVYIQSLSVLRENSVDSEKLATSTIAASLKDYEALLSEKRYLDYTAILERVARILETEPSVRQRLSGRVRHVIVDEYQDVNPVQERIVRTLHELGARVTIVGDDDQTIYAWRGSDIDNILNFAQRYPQVRQVTLNENFRSSKGVVETARLVVEKNGGRLPKKMIAAGAQEYEVGDVSAVWLDDVEQEANLIAKTITQLHGVSFDDDDGERGLTWSDIAILLRSVSGSARPILEALDRAHIPYVVTGFNNLFDASEVRAVVALFEFLAQANGATLQTVRDALDNAMLGLSPQQIGAGLALAQGALQRLRDPDQERWGLYNLQRTFREFLEAIELREESVPNARGEVVFYNLGKFSQLISDFEAIHFKSNPVEKYASFQKFLEHRAYRHYAEGRQENEMVTPDAVRVMTVHQAKGMQWPAVFVPQLVRNKFPITGSYGRQWWHIVPSDAVVGADRFRTSAEDERRLFYVGLTRSQKFLVITGAPTPGNQQAQKRSQFLDEVYESKYVKRRAPDFSTRRRLPSRPRKAIANVALSFSDLKYLFECPYQFKLRVLYGFNPPIHEALGFGKGLHDALAEVHKRAIENSVVTPPHEAAVLVDRHLNVPYAYPSLKEKLIDAAQKTVAAYLTDQSDTLRQLEFSEKQVEIDLGDGVVVNGRIDLVRRVDIDETTIVDFKSSERSQAEEVTELQLHTYALGYRELTGRDADKVEIYELEERRRKARAVDEDFIEGVKAKVRAAGDALRTNSLPATPSVARCGSCDMCGMCGAAIKTPFELNPREAITTGR
jgi:DNA helicase-2/ATP-dependent DNA helicase PcrA